VKVLLDTHAFLWWIADDSRLSDRARRDLSDVSNAVYFSAASAWQIAIKARLGRLKLATADVANFIVEQVTANSFEILPVHLRHALNTYSLPDHHRDPFDRLLVAQAQIEELAVVGADPALADYNLRIIW
jgi:PIN domain nuclease of toxin-antitoxin system